VKGKHHCGDMGGIITFYCNNLSTVCVKTHCITFFMQIMFSVKKKFFNTGVFCEVFSALWQDPLRVCCNYVGFNVTMVAWITRTVSVRQSTN